MTDGSSNHYAFSPNGRGTTCYRAPEMVIWKDERTPPKINNKVDIFALGCILFELVTPRGLKAFPNDYCLIEYNLTRIRPEVTWADEIDHRWRVILMALFDEMLSLESAHRPSAVRLRNIFARHRTVSLGERCFANQEYQIALEAFCIAAETDIDDDNVVAKNIRDLHRELKLFESAKDACVIAMTELLDPSVYIQQARILRANGRHQQALDVYLEYVRRNPNNVDLYDEIGDAYMSVGDHENAILMYSKAIEYEPNAYLYEKLGKAFLGKGDFDSAIYVCKTGSEKYGLANDLVNCYLEATKAKNTIPKRSVYLNNDLILDCSRVVVYRLFLETRF
jgi:tetratricopeptide (TPR) repeat protein